MLYLIIAIVLGSLFTIVFKFCQKHNIDCQQVTFFNYAFGALISWIPIGFKILSNPDVEASSFLLNGSQMSLAAVQGFIYAIGFVVMDRSVWRSGVALTTVASRSSLVLSVLLSWAIFGGQKPSWLAIALVLGALFLIVGPAQSFPHPGVKLRSASDKVRRHKAMAMIVATFFVFGISDLGMKFCQNSISEGGNDAVSAMSGMIFIFSSITALGQCLITGSFKSNPVNIKSIAAGLALGLINIFYTSSIIHSLTSIPTSKFFPVNNIGVVALSTLVGLVLFKEKIKKVQMVGIVLAVGAIALFFI